ncbi:hypothetical protein CBM2586_B10190 [Cupriavidus phytorum]|uniref:Uncharacterized protein n=1 Tax=Cupriavidus taiwanensis TaxID=164546 RepID=A0A975XCG1_9BURK|nr:hypothetical protein [Cupriavidus taiwanensis]SOY65595.1 hypothetical protein CBM2586_B10190 [Cupriavidus taiwanensis]
MAKETSRKFKVTIHSTEDDGSDVLIGVNGDLIQVKRNVEVVIGEAHLEALKNAKIETILKDPDTGVERPITIMRYPFTAVEA